MRSILICLFGFVLLCTSCFTASVNVNLDKNKDLVNVVSHDRRSIFTAIENKFEQFGQGVGEIASGVGDIEGAVSPVGGLRRPVGGSRRPVGRPRQPVRRPQQPVRRPQQPVRRPQQPVGKPGGVGIRRG